MEATRKQLVLSRPPVVETALSVQFVDLPGWSALHHGLYYPLIRDRYPDYSQSAEVPLTVEAFPLIPRVARLQFTSQADAGLAQFVSENGTSLIRVQRNRFAYHWKRLADGTYPHYSNNQSIFEYEFATFQQYCLDSAVGTVSPVMCEVLYLNYILPNEGETIGSLMERAFGTNLGEFEAVTLNRTFNFENRGRVYAEIGVEFDESKPLLKLQLTSRVYRGSNSEIMSTMTTAHDWLMEVFKRVTTETMRKEEWGEQ